jgi:flavorubredoxin
MKPEPVEIAKGIYWVGAVDWEERDFHGFRIERGSSYNAYLVVDEKITLVDTVKQRFFHEMIERVSQVVEPSEIDYIVSNHVETDHSGALADVKELTDATVICTEKGKKGLCKHFDCSEWEMKVVKTGDELSIGRRTLMFVETPMLHWPDNMVTYVKEDKILMSNDAFGQHFASVERYDEEVGVDEAVRWAKLYYANILMPFGELVKRKLEELSTIEIEMIAPSHGVIWKNPQRILEAYSKWASFVSERKLVVVYDTMWESTSRIAKAIAEGAGSEGVDVRVFRVRNDDISDIMAEILDAGGVAIGSSTMHNTFLPSVSSFLTSLQGLRPKGKLGVAFGSYGWSGGAVKQITEVLEKLRFDVLPPLQIRYRPTDEELRKAFDLGVNMAEKIKERV